MKKSERFKVIIDIQAQQEKQSLQALGACQQQKQALEGQLRNLRSYRREYAEKFDAAESRGMSIGQLLEFRAFIDKLDKAIAAQQQTVEDKNKELLRFRKNWEQNHRKTQSLQKIGERAVLEEVKLADKREQAEQDERASRAGRKNGMGTA
ncbi:flagellar export protein FliJ [Methylomarinum vadi]|uniref:flagellar export protein FliJ n=1 Tax=Methylomarinum vadi TaxID=438855 RepID=UPI0004DF0096|nr:flagellar export protein FliJ [Methylomarinum vadi]